MGRDKFRSGDVDPREKYGGPPTFNMSEELYGLEGREIPDFWLEPPGLQRESPERPRLCLFELQVRINFYLIEYYSNLL